MNRYIRQLGESVRKGDLILLLLCLMTTAFGCLIISSTTSHMETIRLVVVQIIAAALGVLLFAITSSVDAEYFSEHRTALLVISSVLLLLLIPFGTDNGSGNKSWLDIPLVPVNIQPAEICKIFYVLMTASVMASHQNQISHYKSVLHMAWYLIFLVGLNMALSGDLGVSLIFVFIFAGMAFAGGVSIIWFLVAGGAMVVLAPIAWQFLGEYQKLRIQILFDPTIDPQGTGPRWHTVNALKSLTGGGMLGQGLFEGHRTQQGMLNAQHTDYIFAAIGEELGFIGCALVLVLLSLIIARCIWVGTRSQDYTRRLICYGCASALIFQVFSNVGMCLGVTPVIGLTLPFISYGGSSIVSLYAMMGLVSGVYARPAATSHERYIRPPLSSYSYR